MLILKNQRSKQGVATFATVAYGCIKPKSGVPVLSKTGIDISNSVTFVVDDLRKDADRIMKDLRKDFADNKGIEEIEDLLFRNKVTRSTTFSASDITLASFLLPSGIAMILGNPQLAITAELSVCYADDAYVTDEGETKSFVKDYIDVRLTSIAPLTANDELAIARGKALELMVQQGFGSNNATRKQRVVVGAGVAEEAPENEHAPETEEAPENSEESEDAEKGEGAENAEKADTAEATQS